MRPKLERPIYVKLLGGGNSLLYGRDMRMNYGELAGGKGDQERILADIFSYVTALDDVPVRKIISGKSLVGVLSRRMGLCSTAGQGIHSGPGGPPTFCDSAQELASLLISPQKAPKELSYAIASINSILPIPEYGIPLKAQDIISTFGKNKNVAIIGHFPFVEKMGPDFKSLWVFDMSPGPGDLPVEAEAELLPQAQVIALTATTLLNGTCAHILSLVSKDAFVLMLGPSTPFVPCLFDWGIDALAGSYVMDPITVSKNIIQGIPFKKIKGVCPLIWFAKKRWSFEP